VLAEPGRPAILVAWSLAGIEVLRVEVFDDAGHPPFDDAPERFAAMLAGLCAEVDAAR
jgi:pimeloyl-ACP methyl ester carboxylesterase